MSDKVYQIISVLAIAASFVPLALLIAKKLWKENAFLLFALYWMLGGIMNILDTVPGLSKANLETITVVYNMLDMPMVLGIIFYTTASARLRNFTRFATPAFLLVQLINFFIRGWHYDAAKYVMALGLILVLTVVVWEISIYMSKLEHTPHEKAMIFIHVSLLFAYGTFVIIYIFDYFVNQESSVGNFIVYYISTLIAILIASIGYFSKGSSRSFI